jgi:hypothetical protein
LKLEVHSSFDDENYLDIARIPSEFRTTRQGRPIESGSVCRVYCEETGREVFVIARGLSGEKGPRIRIDYHVRQRLGVKNHQTYDFDLKEADFCGEVLWALHATDTQYSFAAKVSLLSLALGIVGILIAVIPLFHH